MRRQYLHETAFAAGSPTVSPPAAEAPGPEMPTAEVPARDAPRTEFADVVYADPAWVRAEFDAIIDANFADRGKPPPFHPSPPVGPDRGGHRSGRATVRGIGYFTGNDPRIGIVRLLRLLPRPPPAPAWCEPRQRGDKPREKPRGR